MENEAKKESDCRRIKIFWFKLDAGVERVATVL